jgi:hypothetical protein
MNKEGITPLVELFARQIFMNLWTSRAPGSGSRIDLGIGTFNILWSDDKFSSQIPQDPGAFIESPDQTINLICLLVNSIPEIWEISPLGVQFLRGFGLLFNPGEILQIMDAPPIRIT